MKKLYLLALLPVFAFSFAGCGGEDETSSTDTGTGAAENSKYTILDTRTDGFDFGKAKAQAQDAIAKYDDLGCMVGLFAYNPPLILDAVREAGKIGDIKVVGFDEEAGTLQGIVDGEVYGTVVQDPYKYGYESVRVLAGLQRGDKSVIPEGGFLSIPARSIRKDNVESFWADLKKLTAEDKGGEASTKKKDEAAGDQPKVAYVTNGIASFWVIAEKGAKDAGKEFNAAVEVLMPPNGVEDQKRMCQDALAKGIQGIAISPIDPDNQQDLLDEISDNTNLITQDSDAPKSKRLCYIGMDNYTAGRECGKLIKEAMPDGGKVMIFVGRLGQANARQRRQGVIDELLDRSHDPTRYDEPGSH
ncbi:MAG: substrate-binding domain-containing protein [Planctomycetota bacterium]|nr:substrate-binding domain-containing protein [Planctomycetota bacterium]MDA1250584.1 substrate-binding domain-containing protein [Planctomycetota bacterium]